MQFLKENRRFLILCLLFGLITAQRYCLGFVGLALFLTLFWLPITLFKAWRRPAERARRLSRLGTWLGVCGLVVVVHLVRQDMVRTKADSVAQALSQYQAQHANYPADLGVLGMDAEALRRGYGIHYWFRDGKPMLVYSSPTMFLVTVGYDFDRHRWKQLPN